LECMRASGARCRTKKQSGAAVALRLINPGEGSAAARQRPLLARMHTELHQPTHAPVPPSPPGTPGPLALLTPVYPKR
jgi:hypothetical protein